MDYIELHSRSAFSFLEGASVPEELIAAALEYEMPSMALLDRNGVYGSPRFHLSGRKNGIKAHIGAEIDVQCPTSPGSPMSNVQCPLSASQNGLGQNDGTSMGQASDDKQTLDIGHWTLDNQLDTRQKTTFSLPVLVENRTGYQNLCRLITLMKLRVPKHAKPGECSVTLDELAAHAEGLICLTGEADGPLAAAFNQRDTSGALRMAETLIEIFGKGNVYAEIQRHFTRDEEARNQAVVDLARSLHWPLLATNGVCHATRAQREVADVFTCIRNHVRLETAGRLLAGNSERYLKPAKIMQQIFADLPEAIHNTVE